MGTVDGKLIQIGALILLSALSCSKTPQAPPQPAQVPNATSTSAVPVVRDPVDVVTAPTQPTAASSEAAATPPPVFGPEMATVLARITAPDLGPTGPDSGLSESVREINNFSDDGHPPDRPPRPAIQRPTPKQPSHKTEHAVRLGPTYRGPELSLADVLNKDVNKVLDRKDSKIRGCVEQAHCAARPTGAVRYKFAARLTLTTNGTFSDVELASAPGSFAACVQAVLLGVRGLPGVASPQAFSRVYDLEVEPWPVRCGKL